MTHLDLRWAPAAHYRRLASAVMLPLLAAVIWGNPGYLVLAAPLVAALAAAARRPRYGAAVSVTASADRCFEGEAITISVTVTPGGPASVTGASLHLPAALHVTGAASAAAGGGALETRWQVMPRRWGRWDGGGVRVSVRSRGGLFTGMATAAVPQIIVFPQPPPLSQLVLPAELHNRIGEHTGRSPGEGVEFAGIRPYAPGDRLRRVNWPVTSRRGTLHVNQLAAERAADVVAVIDAFTDTGQPGRTTLDRAVRGAAGLARAYTRAGDRAGVIVLAGPLRWIPPGSGVTQFFRIAETVLDARTGISYVPPDLNRIPRPALPPGALVVMFTPLLDERAINAAIDLRQRGHAVIITDVLASGPQLPTHSGTGPLALRLWLLEREALRYRLESLGIPVTGWPGEPPTGSTGPAAASLDAALGRFARHPVRGGR